jgi:hypothetical protein
VPFFSLLGVWFKLTLHAHVRIHVFNEKGEGDMSISANIIGVVTKPVGMMMAAFYQEVFRPVYNLMNFKERVCLLFGVFSGLNIVTRPWKLLWLVLSVALLHTSLKRHWNSNTYHAHVKPPLKKGLLGVLDKLL